MQSDFKGVGHCLGSGEEAKQGAFNKSDEIISDEMK